MGGGVLGSLSCLSLHSLVKGRLDSRGDSWVGELVELSNGLGVPR